MVIGIDVDDTINELSPVFLRYAQKFNIEMDINHNIDKNQWDLNKAFGWTQDNYTRFSKMYLEKLLNEAEPKKDAVSIINKLKKEGNKIIIITSRSKTELADPYYTTQKWLEDKNIAYDKLIVNSFNKTQDCIDNSVNVFIDDRIEICEPIYSNMNIPVYLFDSIYNQHYQDTKLNRISSWESIYLEIGKLSMKNY